MTNVQTMATGRIREVIDLVEPETEADPVGVLAALLSQASCFLGDKLILDDGGRRTPVSLWTLLIGPTGKGRKGTAYGMAARVMDKAAPDFLSAHETSGASSGAGIINAFVRRRDGALEAMRECQEAGKEYDGLHPGDSRMLLVEEEYATVLKRGKRDATLQGVMRKAWDAQDLQNMVKDGGVIRSPHFVIHGHITAKEFRDNLSSTDVAGGSYNRMLCVSVLRSKRLGKRHRIDEDAIRQAGSTLRHGLTEAARIGSIDFSDEAIDLFDDSLTEEIEEYGADDETIQDFLPRAEANVGRVAALYAALDGRDEIEVADVRAAWNFVRYCLDSIADVMGAPEDDNVSKVVRVLRQHPEGLKSRELQRMTKVVGPELALIVEAHPNITVETISTGGRPAKVHRWVEETADEPETADEAPAGRPDEDEADVPAQPMLRVVRQGISVQTNPFAALRQGRY